MNFIKQQYWLRGYDEVWWCKAALYSSAQAKREPSDRLSSGDDSEHVLAGLVGDFWPCCEVQGRHVSSGRREADIRAEADELPGPLRHVPRASALIPRTPDALRRLRRAAPERTQR